MLDHASQCATFYPAPVLGKQCLASMQGDTFPLLQGEPLLSQWGYLELQHLNWQTNNPGLLHVAWKQGLPFPSPFPSPCPFPPTFSPSSPHILRPPASSEVNLLGLDPVQEGHWKSLHWTPQLPICTNVTHLHQYLASPRDKELHWLLHTGSNPSGVTLADAGCVSGFALISFWSQCIPCPNMWCGPLPLSQGSEGTS